MKKYLPFHFPSFLSFLLAFLCLNSPVSGQENAAEPQVKVSKIWDAAQHNAFTSLVVHKGAFYCAFREGGRHLVKSPADYGKVRVLTSEDGEKWESFALLEAGTYDLRDPQITFTPAGKMMLLMEGVFHDHEKKKTVKTHNQVSFLDEKSKTFSPPQPVVYQGALDTGQNWIWRLTWHKGVGYGVSYRLGLGQAVLTQTTDGIHYSQVADLGLSGQPNEASLRMQPNGDMVMVIRRESDDRGGMVGRSAYPYTDWTWNNTGLRLGGPFLMDLGKDQLLLGTRDYLPERKARTAIYRLNSSGQPVKLLELASGGDTSYPEMVIHKRELWISYYSSHEGKASIYLARIPRKDLLALLKQ
ncbi:MAG: hypothetical protein ACO1NZ_17700 [Adhaeribacter sp.]